MPLLDRLKGQEEPTIPGHQFYAHLIGLGDGQYTRADIEGFWQIPTTGTDSAQLDAIINGWTAAADKGRFADAVHAITMLVEASDPDDVQFPDITNASAQAWFDAAAVPYPKPYGGLYVSVTGPAQAIPPGVFTKLDALVGANAMPSSGGVVSDTVGGVVTLAVAGDYRLSYSLSFLGTNNTDLEFSLFGNGVEVDAARSARTVSSSSDLGSVGASVIANAPVAGIDIDLRVLNTETNSRDITPRSFQLTAEVM